MAWLLRCFDAPYVSSRVDSYEDRILDHTNHTAELVERDAWLDLFDAASGEVRESLEIASTTIAGIGLLGCRAIPITELNRAMAVGVEGTPTTRELDSVIAWLDEQAASWALQVAPDAEAPAIRDYLDQATLGEAGSGWAKFIGTDISSPSEPINTPVVVEVVDGRGANLFGRTVTEGFGLPPICGTWFAALTDRPFWQCFVALVNGEVAGAGAMFARDDAAWFGIEATLQAYRGRGAQRGIISSQLRAAAAVKATVLTCEMARPIDRADAGFSSYRNQEWAGLAHAYTRPNFKRSS